MEEVLFLTIEREPIMVPFFYSSVLEDSSKRPGMLILVTNSMRYNRRYQP